MKTKKIILYSKGFYELLNVIYFIIQNHLLVENIIQEENYYPSLLDNTQKIEGEEDTYSWWQQHTSNTVLEIAKDVYLTEDPYKELILYYFLKNALKYPQNITQHFELKCVNKALKLSKYVHRETHKMKGFLRFKEMKNLFLYAEMEPENCIIFELANHFTHRLKNNNFVIFDKKRGIYAFYDQKQLKFMSKEDVIQLNLEEKKSEKEIEDLWKTFFDTIAIQERENLRCQRNFMPKKYWKYMIEMENRI